MRGGGDTVLRHPWHRRSRPRLGLELADEHDGELQHLLELDEALLQDEKDVALEAPAAERAGGDVADGARRERLGDAVGAGLAGGGRAVDLLHGALHGDGAVEEALLEVGQGGVEPGQLALQDGRGQGAGLGGRVQGHGHQRLRVHLPRRAGDPGRLVRDRRDGGLDVEQPLPQLAHAALRVRRGLARLHDRARAGREARRVEGGGCAEGEEEHEQGRGHGGRRHYIA
jgi:hypothetical protein